MSMQHHAFAIGAGKEEGITEALAWAERELGMNAKGNPDIVVLRYGLLSVEDARNVIEAASGAPLAGENKAVIIAVDRAYHEAQNALLKLFEEPPRGTHLFLVLPNLGGLLPTLRSRVQTLHRDNSRREPIISSEAETFLKAGKEKRSAMIKKIAEHKAGDAASAREEAIALLNGIEAAAYTRCESLTFTPEIEALFEDIATMRGHLYDRSAPVKMILEHLAIVVPTDLV